MNEKTGNLIIVAAPSGGGKTSLVKELVHALTDIEVSISHTTRAIRPGEKDGVDYFFINDETFSDMVKTNAFIEHAEVFNHFYGTSKMQINSRLSEGIDVVLDIDWQGAQQIKDIFPNAISIFIVPPSLDVLKERLKARGQDKDEIIQYRMDQAKSELSHFAEFDYLVVNDDFAKAASELQAIVIANRLKLSSQNELQGKLLPFLLASK